MLGFRSCFWQLCPRALLKCTEMLVRGIIWFTSQITSSIRPWVGKGGRKISIKGAQSLNPDDLLKGPRSPLPWHEMQRCPDPLGSSAGGTSIYNKCARVSIEAEIQPSNPVNTSVSCLACGVPLFERLKWTTAHLYWVFHPLRICLLPHMASYGRLPFIQCWYSAELCSPYHVMRGQGSLVSNFDSVSSMTLRIC